jgi:hypothetical protein
MMMSVVRTSETSVSFNVTIRGYIPEEFKLEKKHLDKNTFSKSVIKVTVLWDVALRTA